MEDDAFVRFLKEHKHCAIYICASPGNSGDLLLQKGLEIYLARNKFTIVDEPVMADMIVIHGGSNINDIWHCGITLLTNMIREYPDTPIVAAPHTYQFFKTDFSKLVNKATQEVHLFAREEKSYQRLAVLPLQKNIHIYLANDTAFLLHNTPYLISLQNNCTEEYILFAMRTDRESMLLRAGLDVIPTTITEKCKFWFIKRRLQKFLQQRHSKEFSETKIHMIDVSYLAFDEFVHEIMHASAIYTDRLHVGILGALLGKEVHLYRTKHDKLQSVFAHSLQNYPNVILEPTS